MGGAIEGDRRDSNGVGVRELGCFACQHHRDCQRLVHTSDIAPLTLPCLQTGSINSMGFADFCFSVRKKRALNSSTAPTKSRNGAQWAVLSHPFTLPGNGVVQLDGGVSREVPELSEVRGFPDLNKNNPIKRATSSGLIAWNGTAEGDAFRLVLFLPWANTRLQKKGST